MLIKTATYIYKIIISRICMRTNDIKSENQKDIKFNFFHIVELFKMPIVIMTLIQDN